MTAGPCIRNLPLPFVIHSSSTTHLDLPGDLGDAALEELLVLHQPHHQRILRRSEAARLERRERVGHQEGQAEGMPCTAEDIVRELKGEKVGGRESSSLSGIGTT